MNLGVRNMGWQLGELDNIVIADIQGTFDGVFQFAHIPRPRIGIKELLHFLA